jgi:hypothetical protein
VVLVAVCAPLLPAPVSMSLCLPLLSLLGSLDALLVASGIHFPDVPTHPQPKSLLGIHSSLGDLPPCPSNIAFLDLVCLLSALCFCKNK